MPSSHRVAGVGVDLGRKTDFPATLRLHRFPPRPTLSRDERLRRPSPSWDGPALAHADERTQHAHAHEAAEGRCPSGLTSTASSSSAAGPS
jgi:hypothetical protein